MRDFDVVLYGATGFSGRQCVKYFTQQALAGIRWALTDRDRTKWDQLEVGVPAMVGIRFTTTNQ